MCLCPAGFHCLVDIQGCPQLACQRHWQHPRPWISNTQSLALAIWMCSLQGPKSANKGKWNGEQARNWSEVSERNPHLAHGLGVVLGADLEPAHPVLPLFCIGGCGTNRLRLHLPEAHSTTTKPSVISQISIKHHVHASVEQVGTYIIVIMVYCEVSPMFWIILHLLDSKSPSCFLMFFTEAVLAIYMNGHMHLAKMAFLSRYG